jgi:hypothetical protein
MQTFEAFKDQKATEASTRGIKEFLNRIVKLATSKGITINKLFKIWGVLQKAEAEVKAILAEK